MRIDCPHCGTRDLREFTYQGVALDRPGGDARWSDAWDDYLHLRDNPAGRQRETWYHEPCGTWLVLDRDTASHAVHGSTLPGIGR